MTAYFDTLDTLDPQSRETMLFSKLPGFLAEIARDIPGWGKRLADVDTAAISSRAALSSLPVLRKAELMEAQAAEPPFGGFVNMAHLDGSRIFMSPGPVWEPQGLGTDPWGAARAFHA
ncbi:MAG: phenylacetate--CoA ligase family protein, partial [Nitratireductor sp.]|nr:phenylacetate--CoA ligase family protein [Nitratireductor sp.]